MKKNTERLIAILTLHCGKPGKNKDNQADFTYNVINKDSELKLINSLREFFEERGVLMDLFKMRKTKKNIDRAIASILFNYGPTVTDE